MNLKIKFKGPISLVTGEKLTLNLPENAKISDLINDLRRKYLRKAEIKSLDVVFRDFTAQNLILVNERDISALKGVETKLKQGDAIMIINFTHGG